MPCPCRTEAQGGDRFGRKGHFWPRVTPRRLADLRLPMQKLLVRSWSGPENFISICFSIKSYSTFSGVQTHQRILVSILWTHRHMPFHPCKERQKFYGLFNTFHFTTLILLTPFVKEILFCDFLVNIILINSKVLVNTSYLKKGVSHHHYCLIPEKSS
jgi:hypothetical protein